MLIIIIIIIIIINFMQMLTLKALIFQSYKFCLKFLFFYLKHFFKYLWIFMPNCLIYPWISLFITFRLINNNYY